MNSENSETVLEKAENSSVDDSEPVNPEFEAMLIEATTTKERERAKDSASSSKKTISDTQAANIVAKGLGGMITLANQFGGLDIELNDDTANLVISLFCPLVQKYGGKFEVNSSGVDLDGWMPELMAAGGVGLLGITVRQQIKNKSEEDAADGDQSKHG